MGFQNYFRML